MKEKTSHTSGFDILEPTDISVVTTPRGRSFNVRNDIDELVPVKKTRGLFSWLSSSKTDGSIFEWVDSQIIKWFGDVTFHDAEPAYGRIYLLKNSANDHSIIEEARNLAIYQPYDIVQALLIANKVAKAIGKKRDFSLIIYLKQTKNDTLYFLLISWNSDGSPGLYISKDSGLKWNAGFGVLLM